MGELLPCPFCGGDAEINQIGNEATKTRGYEVKCRTFGCSTTKRGMVVKHTLAKAREWAVERWNTRPRTEGRGDEPGPFSPITENGLTLHPVTADLVSRFMGALAGKLAAAEAKYGYSDGWASPIWQEECRRQLHHHAAKGDPRDVAAYAAFCWHHGWSTASPIREPEISREAVKHLVRKAIEDAQDSAIPEPWEVAEHHAGIAADAILNLAPVGGRGEVSASDRAFVRHLIREMRSAIADDPNDATITTGPLDPDILERVLNVALGAQEQGGMK